MVQIVQGTPFEIPLIKEIAEETWPHAYGQILEPDQLRFMLDSIYSKKALEQVMNDGSQKFLLLKDHEGYQGFAAYGRRPNEPEVYKLHKIYIRPGCQGKGYGKMLIDEIKSDLRKQGVRLLDLNVNRYNPAKEFYLKLGFKVIREEDVPIGPYWMNDYVMRMTID